jgi:hypothetical protein
MDNQIDNMPKQQADLSTSETTNEKQLDRICRQLAKRAERREQSYDQDHDIFTK